MLKLALPAGDLRRPLAHLLGQAGLPVAGYREGSRSYRLQLDGRDGVLVRVFREKDIPIQIALGNYDIGICGLAWVEEFLARYPREAIVKVGGLGVGASRLYVVGAGNFASLREAAMLRSVRIASEFPNLAEAFAMAARLPRYHILPVWGAAEAYPPEDADLALVLAQDDQDIAGLGLTSLHLLLENSAWLIAHRQSLQEKDISPILGSLLALAPAAGGEPRLRLPGPLAPGPARPAQAPSSDKLRIALPDGHLQQAARRALADAGIAFAGYSDTESTRRPQSALAGLEAKVLRPQDMPQLVASGSFDLAVCGRDCLRNHLYRFPASPVEEVVDLGTGRFDLCAVVSRDLPAATMAGALDLWKQQGRAVIRIASEFVNIADHYARSHHFWRYQVIPLAGASEGFVPEDADLLIEGTETGQTLAENNLKAIDLLFQSSLCLIARREEAPAGEKGALFREMVGRLAHVSRTRA